MRHLLALIAVATIAACGVDGAPIRPGETGAVDASRNATTTPEPGKWVTGTASMHTAVAL